MADDKDKNEDKNNGSGNTNNTDDDKAKDAETITITNPYGLCGDCGWEPDGDKSYKNYCPMCHKTGTLIIHQSFSNSGQATEQEEISCRGDGGCGSDFCGKCGDELDGTHRSKLIPADGAISDSSSSTSGSGAQIKDKTFEDCIRRICAATDSIFVIENNAAVLFPYTDWLAFTLYKDLSVIKSEDIDPEIYEAEFNIDSVYNKVTAVWGDAELPERVFNTDSKIEHTDTTTTTTEKNNVDGTVLFSKQYDALVEQFGELEKRVKLAVTDRSTAEYIVNSLLIQYVREFNNNYKIRTLNNQKYIGGTFYTVQNLYSPTSILYLNGYTIRTQKDEPLYIDLDFRYGPEGVEDIGDYQKYTGGGASGNSSAGQVIGSDAIEIGNSLASMYTFCAKSGSESYAAMKEKKCGSCWAWSDALYTELQKIGYTVRIVEYATSMSSNHRSVQYKDESGQWVDYPYRDTNIPNLAYNTSGSSGGKVIAGGD